MKKYRNEWKYCCTQRELDTLAERLSAVLERDINADADGKSVVHSLYFDDYRDSCARENEAKIAQRYKYRIRFYGNNTDFLKLEKKEKLYGRCCKTSCVISREQYELIMQGNTNELFWQTDDQLLKRFCMECMLREFRPKAIIDYERFAYVEPVTNIRITIDKNISVSDESEDFLFGRYQRYPLQETGQHVLEVKFDSILPGYIKQIVMSPEIMQTNFSKYYFGRLKLQEMRR